MSKQTPDLCPCGGASLAQCCGPLLEGSVIATHAEQLMRSRYSAYALGREDYLKASWHASTRPAETVTDAAIKWLGFEVRSAQEAGDEAQVEFVARCRVQGRGHRLHETSRFVREDGRWYYVDGDFEQPETR